jgi:hypothetical protein
MTDTVQNGKGDQDRTIDFDKYRDAYDEIFRSKKGGKDDKSK